MSFGEADFSKVVIWGASGHALVVGDIFRARGDVEVVGYLDDRKEKLGTAMAGKTVLGGREILTSLRANGVSRIVIAIGDCRVRVDLASYAIAAGFELVNAIHPASVVSPWSTLGRGVVACAGAIVNAACDIGSNVILNTGCSVDHECLIEDGVHVGPGAHLGGRVTVGRGAWIGLGASVNDKVTIGSLTTVGAGSVVTKSLPSNVVAFGVPARVMREID